MARNGFFVHLAILVPPFDLVPRVAEVDVVALFPSEVFLPGGLDAGLARIVSRTILAWMGLYVLLVDFGDVTEKVASGIDRIVPDAPDLPSEPGEIVLELSEFHVSLRFDLLEHDHALVADLFLVTGIFPHLLLDEIDAHIEGGSKHQGVERSDFPRRHENVVSDFVTDDYLSIPVVDDSPCRVDHVVDHGIVRRVYLVLVINDLDVEQLAQKDSRDDQQAYQQDPAAVVTFGRHSSAD